MAVARLAPGLGRSDDMEVSEEAARKYNPPQVFPLMKNPILTLQLAVFHGVRLVLLLVKMPTTSTDVAQLLRLVV